MGGYPADVSTTRTLDVPSTGVLTSVRGDAAEVQVQVEAPGFGSSSVGPGLYREFAIAQEAVFSAVHREWTLSDRRRITAELLVGVHSLAYCRTVCRNEPYI